MRKIELSDIQIRNTLLPGDLGYIAHMHGDLYARECGYGINFEAYVLEGLKDFARAYNPTQDKVWICQHEGRIIGSLVAQYRGTQIQLRYFIFQPEYRGIGLGKKLLEEFIGFVREKGIRHIYLLTSEEQHAAIALYTKLGFTLTEEKYSETFDKPLIERRYDLTLS
ncbi:GNAT family N-acetyltransferase [Chitinophaga pinensis]|uniref:GCN5-related N-acetyltransferase n=1 Tax=Chitinophaga pinensis (strain ATCC 43595 / DSM 2588 / LMG 13176 / NBRC 15968 / NCIMB 11800 / UQM 2034) TaxID=485918 RepID=A0A979G3F8_CHIPD|nr:GNAT family N-acetyltransferase [Chitinophaga pinensis]ACU60134.1 GCN5-related N-acetyltransferase [Chitinophaga pinensis DSM 2588]